MTKKTKQIVIFIHGVGPQDVGYSTLCRKKIKKTLGTLKIEPKEICFKEILWSNVTSEKQVELLEGRILENDKLSWLPLRRFFFSFAGDAISAQRGNNWEQIQSKINDTIAQVKHEFSDGNYNFEFTFISHSLGTVLITNYLVQENQAINKEEVVNLFTLGSPLAVWSMMNGWPSEKRNIIEINKEVGSWINILDKDDIIAYPLKNVSDQYNLTVCKDYITSIGGLVSGKTPLCHTEYWDDMNVIKPIAKKVAIDYMRIHEGVKYNKNEYFKYIDQLINI